MRSFLFGYFHFYVAALLVIGMKTLRAKVNHKSNQLMILVGLFSNSPLIVFVSILTG